VNPALRTALLRLTQALAAQRITLTEWREAVVTLLTEAVPDIDDAALVSAVANVRGTERAEDVVARLEALLTPASTVNGVAVAAGAGIATFLAQAALRPRSTDTTRLEITPLSAATLNTAATRFETRASRLAEALADERLTVQEWRLGMANEIADLHVAAYVVGAGGVDNLDAEDFAVLNAKLNEQLDYLNAWAAELENGELPSLKALQARQNLYAGAANATLYEAQAQSVGLPALPAYPADGTSTCRTNDGCRWEIVRLEGSGNFDCYWRLSPAEHCEICLERSRVWNPLKVRDGVIEPYNSVGLFIGAA